MYIFGKPGQKNTEKALEILTEGLKRYPVKEVVIASTYGDTGLAAARLLKDTGVKLIVITHNCEFKRAGSLEMTPKMKSSIEELGAVVYTGTMPFRNIGTAIRARQSYSQQELIADTLRIMGQGMKVCVEIAMMAADAGLVGTDDILTVAGTARGADTVALVKPAPSNRLFDVKVRDILAKPFEW